MKIQFSITGMTCAACAARVEKVARKIDGVASAEVNLLAGTLTVEASSEAVSETIIRGVTASGYGASVFGKKEHEKPDNALQHVLLKLILSGCFLIALMYFTMGHMLSLPMPKWYHGAENAVVGALVQLFLSLPILFLNRSYYVRGFRALWHKAPNMDTLIAVGSSASYLYGVIALFRMSYALGHGNWEAVEYYSQNLYFESAAMILTLITLGKYLESRAKSKTGDAIKQLMDLRPKNARVLKNGVFTEVPVETVQVGDIIALRSGESVPVDGTVIKGSAALNQGVLTGESVPVEKQTGDTVTAATIVAEGYLEVRADKVGQDTTLFQIIQLVEQAGASKAPIARLADKISGVFVPVVIGIALVVFAVWFLVGAGFEFSLTTAVAVLVISCPCALGLATPVAIMVGIGKGARMGILFRNAQALENLHKADTVVLDKTGTLTVGKPAVTDVIPQGVSNERLLYIAASLEAKSEHPFAKAIMDKIGQGMYPEAEKFTVLPGQGVSGYVDGVQYYAGNRRLMTELGVDVPELSELRQQGKTPLYFASANKEYIGGVVVSDVLKEDSQEAVALLHRLGLKVIMLTGDNQATANAIGNLAGIDQVLADVLPGDKAGMIADLQKSGHNVLMVGDGINDAPALATANVGIAIGAGTDIAIETADVVLMQNSLVSISHAVELSKATMRNIRQNLFWAFFYNCLGIPVAAGVLYPAFQIQLSPMLGAAAMSMSSVFVVSNALRLRFFKPRTSAVSQREIVREEAAMNSVIVVNGMMCSHCKARVEDACKKVSGVTDAVVDLSAKQVTVTGEASLDSLKKAITDAGYEVVD